MKTYFALLILAVVALTCAKAEDMPAAKDTSTIKDTPASNDAPVPKEAPTITLKNKSVFTMDASGRNPFWPIGWKPVAKVAANDHGGSEIQPEAFVVSSITYDRGGRFAIINGKAMQAGQQFGLQLGNQTYQLTVKAIEDGRVILLRRDEEIIVPLRRK
jgi:hypothetical protein